MRKINKLLLASTFAVSLLSSCDKKSNEQVAQLKSEIEKLKESNTAVESILTAEEQAKLSPKEIIGRLKKGNENFINNNLTQRNHSSQRRKAMIGQFPKAIVLSCVDSRVPVEDVFDLGIGDIFVARVAGNIENEDIVGSMEFATAVAGSKVIIVLGHTSCGAIKSTIDNVDAKSLGMNSLAALLDKIKPAVADIETDSERTSKNTEFTNDVISHNAARTVENIRKASPTIKQLESQGKLMIVSAVYDMETGKVNFNPTSTQH